MNFSSFFPKEFMIDGMEVEDINMRCRSKSSLCPECGAKSERIHSRYIRTLQDLMVFGKTVTIKLLSRKFFCDNSSCTRSIFTERFETLIKSYSRRTERLNEALVKFAFSLSSEAASRILKYIFHQLSSDTFIRIIRKEQIEIKSDFKHIGIDN
ncbi:transposase [Clostridium tetanomorphum]|uniref:Transposase family protein n=1 Tax=Clostridium tetanomorphum TaxID=1553 RepID=A0A923J1X9_CLOTT|nr:transposase family protein [Clostridium tetanomorphum]KAJ50081.1 transposase, IS204/IS1001/IS1096/IS1165 [Clostridium tetanomorphum DSM 665]MBC2399249.1 transposase family protein [Clostridium tetanomorphum]MBP1862826.1 transposase [Clostridium tetanomorphum]NRS86963.1 transposase [Clostridium tetanomorphum]NRZ99253.1 transposase [Clostridium tetanomorphum]